MKINIGESFSYQRAFTQEDVKTFSELTGDINPIHLDEEFSKKSIFGRTIVHGMLYSSMISNILANHLPGNGTIYLGQDLKFLKPVFPDQIITAEVTVMEIDPVKKHIILKTKVYNDTGIVLDGSARVINQSVEL